MGWGLLLTGFLSAAWLDPWTLAETSPANLPGSALEAARMAQAVLLAMAFAQLAVAEALARASFRPFVRRWAPPLTAAGALIYALGYAVTIERTGGEWLIPLGALLNFAGFGMLAGGEGRADDAQPPGGTRPASRQVDARSISHQPLAISQFTTHIVLGVIAFGMLLDAAVGLSILAPDVFRPEFIGPVDGVRLRMLRLARVAAIALSVLVMIWPGAEVRERMEERKNGRKEASGWVRWGWMGLLIGAVGMPLVLTTAALTDLRFKYLLPIPADAVFLGTLAGAWLAMRQRRRLEAWGWSLIAGSMVVGLLVGGYAFDGPLRSPEFMGAYNDFTRRVTRLGHAYCIVLGLLTIFVARLRASDAAPTRSFAAGRAMLVVGTVVTLLMLGLRAVEAVPPGALSVGPLVVAIGVAACLGARSRASSVERRV